MKRTMRSAVVLGVAGAIGLLAAAGGVGVSAQGSGEQAAAASDAGDWPMYRGDPAGTGFSSLDGITAANVADLAEAWTYSLLAEDDSARGPNSQATPIVVDGVMYLPAADRVVALDAASGREIWRHALDGARPSRRGVAWWAGGEGMDPRIIFTTGQHLRALDAATGMPVESFGEGGAVDMVVPYNSVPLVHGDVVVVGANTPAGTIGGIGNARAFDARTGAPVWEFSSVAQPGQPGHDTWGGDSWQGRLGANAWPFYFSMDTERGHVYLPLASPIPGDYGGDRPGDNLYGNSLVAVDIATGEYRWHFQTIHHDLWDADPPAPPALFDIPRDGGAIAALGVTTKSGYLYILDRETGEPVYGVEERPVAASDVPGEATAPTQPIPLKPVGSVQAHLGPRRPRDRRGHLARARRRVPRPRRQPRRNLQRRSVHPLGLPRPRRPPSDHPLVPRRGRRRQLGRGGGGPRDRLSPRRHPGPRRPRLRRGGASRASRAVPQGRPAPRQLRGATRRRDPAVPPPAVGSADRGRRGDRRRGVAGGPRESPTGCPRAGRPPAASSAPAPSPPAAASRSWPAPTTPACAPSRRRRAAACGRHGCRRRGTPTR